MLHGRVVRPPVINSKPSSVDADSIKHILGIVKVVQDGNFLGVVAQTEWAAIQAARSLKVIWSAPATKFPANPEEMYAYLKNTKSFVERTGAEKGMRPPPSRRQPKLLKPRIAGPTRCTE